MVRKHTMQFEIILAQTAFIRLFFEFGLEGFGLS